jgi:hypothetical protein
VEIVGGPDVHLADLVLSVDQLLLQPFLRHADLVQQLLHLAQLRLHSGCTCRGRCIQLLRGQRRKAAQLVSPAGDMSSEQRRNKLQHTASDSSAAAEMRRRHSRPICDRRGTFRGRRAGWPPERTCAPRRYRRRNTHRHTHVRRDERSALVQVDAIAGAGACCSAEQAVLGGAVAGRQHGRGHFSQRRHERGFGQAAVHVLVPLEHIIHVRAVEAFAAERNVLGVICVRIGRRGGAAVWNRFEFGQHHQRKNWGAAAAAALDGASRGL